VDTGIVIGVVIQAIGSHANTNRESGNARAIAGGDKVHVPN
jgi:hypothetical protein